MSGPRLTPVEEALARILADVRPTAVEVVPLARAAGRILAEAVTARRTQPPFDVSAMDGWAIRAADASAPGARLSVVGESAAGHGFAGRVEAGRAVRIFTGAPVPAGADTVVLQETAVREGDVVVLAEAAVPGLHVRREGLDFRDGDVVLSAGTPISWSNLPLIAAAANVAEIGVRRRPRIALLSTGDELVPPGTTPGPDRIVAANGVALAALIEAAGGEALDLGIVPDDLDAIRGHIRDGFAAGVDAFVTIGGASVGDHDLVHRALAAEGVAFDFWKIAMRPGKPLMFGRKGETRILGLPGNPAAAMVGAAVFLAPLVRTLAGGVGQIMRHETVRLGTDLAANDLRADFLRGRLVRDTDGRFAAVPVDDQDSSLLSRFAAAEVLILRPARALAARAGDPVEILRLA